jgi:hypothetical protein
MKTAAALAFLAIVVGGCASSSNSMLPQLAAAGTSPTGDTTAARVTAPGTSPISPSIQAAFCQDQVAFTYSTERRYATTGERVVAADGSTTIDVTIDKGNGGAKTFKCRLDADNRFIDVVASDGAL